LQYFSVLDGCLSAVKLQKSNVNFVAASLHKILQNEVKTYRLVKIQVK